MIVWSRENLTISLFPCFFFSDFLYFVLATLASFYARLMMEVFKRQTIKMIIIPTDVCLNSQGYSIEMLRSALVVVVAAATFKIY